MIDILKTKLVHLWCLFNFNLPNFRQWELNKEEKSKSQYIVEHTILNQKYSSRDF